jgi:short-subunit dehydrogenase
MPISNVEARQKAAFLTGASSGIGKAARQVARRPRALFDKILRSLFGLA